MNDERWWLAYMVLIFALACVVDGAKTAVMILAVISASIIVWSNIHVAAVKGNDE